MAWAMVDPPTYRYRLFRDLNTQRGLFTPVVDRMVLFVMLNPSTADATHNDPTVRRCVGFATDWAFARMEVVNLFAVRATNPKLLPAIADPVGPDNDLEIAAAVAGADLVVAAWGTNKAAVAPPAGAGGPSRAEHVVGIITTTHDLYALKLTDGGHPQHPLYLAADLKPVLWRKKAA